MLPVLFRRKLRLIITVDGITDITTEAITTDIVTKGITTGITIASTTIGIALGLSASMGVQGIIAIGNRIIVRTALTIADVSEHGRPQLDLKCVVMPIRSDTRIAVLGIAGISQSDRVTLISAVCDWSLPKCRMIRHNSRRAVF